MRSTGVLLDAGWRRFKAAFSLWVRLMAFQIVMTVVVLVGVLLVLLAASSVVVIVLKSSLLLKGLGSLFAAAISVAAIVAAIYFLGGAYLALIVASLGEKRRSITDYYSEGRASVARLVTAQLWLLLWVALLACIPIVLLLVGFGLHSGGINLLAVLLIFALAIGLSLLSVRFALLPFIVIAERVGGRTAVTRAWRLTDGAWWKSLLVVGATQLVALLLGFLDGIATANGGVWSDIWTVVYVLLTLAVTVWTLLVLREFYRDLSKK